MRDTRVTGRLSAYSSLDPCHLLSSIMILALCLTGAASAAAMRLPALSPPRPTARHALMCASPEDHSVRQLRVVTHHPELLSARATAQQVQEPTKKGIHSVSVGGMTVNFSHDMTTTFKWGGLILGLVLVKVLRKGKYAWTEEPNFKYMSRNAAEEAELHEFQCENCGPPHLFPPLYCPLISSVKT